MVLTYHCRTLCKDFIPLVPIPSPVAAQVMRELPPGQGPAIVGFVAASVPRLPKLEVGPNAASPLSALLSGCLIGLRTSLTTALALASALERLISGSLAAPLRFYLLQVTPESCTCFVLPS